MNGMNYSSSGGPQGQYLHHNNSMRFAGVSSGGNLSKGGLFFGSSVGGPPPSFPHHPIPNCGGATGPPFQLPVQQQQQQHQQQDPSLGGYNMASKKRSHRGSGGSRKASRRKMRVDLDRPKDDGWA